MPDEKGKLTPEELKDRWKESPGKEFREEIIRQLKSEDTGHRVDWENLKVTVKGKEFFWIDFPGVREVKENPVKYKEIIFPEKKRPIVKSNSLYGDLRGIVLSWEILPGAQLACTQCKDAALKDAHLEGAHLWFANLKGAHLGFAYLEGAQLWKVHLEGADLSSTNLEGADLRFAKMANVDLTDAKFRFKSWWWRVKDWWYKSKKPELPQPTNLTGAELKNVKLDSDPVLYRELLDEQYLDRFAEKHKILYPVWLLTSNCGRWTFLVFVWTFIFGTIFGLVFSNFSYPSFLPDWTWLINLLDKIDPVFRYNGDPQKLWWQPFYLSFVTMTTLGLASAEPVNDAGFWWHTAQNIIGYILLGYLIAVLGSKFTRRSA